MTGGTFKNPIHPQLAGAPIVWLQYYSTAIRYYKRRSKGTNIGGIAIRRA
jgi:hypothetical protein